MKILLTGAAGFIGSHVAMALLARGDTVHGLDNMNDYYDPALKQARLNHVQSRDSQGYFTFHKGDVTDGAAIRDLFKSLRPDAVIHLAAQAGVRYSLDNPQAYVDSNVTGHLNILEACRYHPVRHLVYASSSSVYGGNAKQPFSVTDATDKPVSLYAATKKANEVMSHCYAHLYRIPATGLRFFTVYGPWGRPDMTPYVFLSAIMRGEVIRLFNHGRMKRDFTYIDDAVAGVLAALGRPPQCVDERGSVPHAIYNIGNNKPETLSDYVAAIEDAWGAPVTKVMEDMQPGDVHETYADIDDTARDLGYRPAVAMPEGIARFVAWFKDYHKTGPA